MFQIFSIRLLIHRTYSRTAALWVSKFSQNTIQFNKPSGISQYKYGHFASLVTLHDTFSWTTLISKHAKCGQARHALTMYRKMREAGVKPSSYTFVAVLKACSSLQDLETAKHIYVEVVESGFESDLYVGTMMVDVFGKCGSLGDARFVFEKMPHRNVVSWTAIILVYAHMEEGEQALHLYTRMQQEGIIPNDRTFVAALKACSSLATMGKKGKVAEWELLKTQCLKQVRAIHSDILSRQSESTTFVGTMLVDVYVKCGCLVDARDVFEMMHDHDVVSWNAIILGYAQMEEGEEALKLYGRMQCEGVVPDERTFVGVLKACSSIAAGTEGNEAEVREVKEWCLNQVKSIHSQLVMSGCVSSVILGTMLVDVYAKCGCLLEARHVFEKISHRDVVSWNSMILGYAQMEEGEVALQLYKQMQQEGVVPNNRTFVGVLKAFSSLAAWRMGNEAAEMLLRKGFLQQVQTIQSDIFKSGCALDVYVGTTLVDVFAKLGSLVDARHVFEKIPHRNVFSWNALIWGYAQMEEGAGALQLYKQLREEGMVPDEQTYLAVLKACSSLASCDKGNAADLVLVKIQCLEQVREIHSHLLEAGSAYGVVMGTMLVDAYAKCGSLVDARHVFEKMPLRNVLSWTAMIFGYAQMEEGEVALQLYTQMQQEGVLPNDRTFVGALKACGSVAGLEKGKEIHAQILKRGLDGSDIFVASCLIDMYGKCGSMTDALQVFNALRTRDSVTWNALIAGYAHHGESELVFRFLDRMRQEGLQPNSITFLCILTLCSHVGLVEKGKKYFEDMTRDHGITPSKEHYNCLIDLLGRAGHLDEAIHIAKTMPFQPAGEEWKSILGACQKWNNVELGKQAFECAVRLDKKDTSAYALMSNIYMAAHMLDEAKEMQAIRMRARAWKQPGQSWWIDMSGVVHSFDARDGQFVKPSVRVEV